MRATPYDEGEEEEEEETDTLVTMPSVLRAAPQRLPGQSRLLHAFD